MNHKLSHYQGVMEIKLINDYDKNKDLPKKETNKRGKVNGFSRKSRRNLFKYILRLENRNGYYFVTLTYPKEYDTNYQTWKYQLRQLFSSLRYHYPKMGFLWKLEFQKRGAPHFHLLMFVPSIPPKEEIGKLIKEHWYRIVGHTSKGFRHWGTDTKEVKDIKASGFYLAMYQTKDSNTPMDKMKSGRSWGVYGRKMMPMSEQGMETLSLDNYIILKRICRKWIAKQPSSRGYANYLKSSRVGSFQVFIPNHVQIRLINWIVSMA